MGPPAPAEPAEVFPPACVGESLAPGDTTSGDNEPLAGVVGLAVEVPGDFVGCSDGLALAVELPQMVPAFGLSCVLVPLGLGLALALARVVGGLDVEVALPLALLLTLGLPLPDVPVVGLGGGLGGGVDGPGEVTTEAEGLDEAGVLLAEGVADDCVQDASGVSRGRGAAAAEPAAAPAAPGPLWPGAAGLVGRGELVPSKAASTDALNACRSGGTEARTTPMAKTTQARAMAGLIRPTRQSRCGLRRTSPALCPARRAFQRRTMSASTPVLAGTALADTALADTALADTALADTVSAPTRARIRSSPSGRGST
jgi:hypothetical protein